MKRVKLAFWPMFWVSVLRIGLWALVLYLFYAAIFQITGFLMAVVFGTLLVAATGLIAYSVEALKKSLWVQVWGLVLFLGSAYLVWTLTPWPGGLLWGGVGEIVLFVYISILYWVGVANT